MPQGLHPSAASWTHGGRAPPPAGCAVVAVEARCASCSPCTLVRVPDHATIAAVPTTKLWVLQWVLASGRLLFWACGTVPP